MRDKLFVWLRTILVVIISAVVGYIALILVYMLPVDQIRENVGDSLDVLEQEGITHNVIEGYDTTRLDNYTEGLTFNSAIFDSNDSVFEKAASIHQYRYQDAQMYYDALFEYYSGNENYYVDEYARDWHGYLVFVKPALLLFYYSAIRMINLIIQLILVVLICIFIYRDEKVRPYLVAFGVLLFFITAPMLFMSMEYSALFYVILISVLYIMHDNSILKSEKGRSIFFALIGIAVAYVDVLTFPLLTFGIPMVFWYIKNGETKDTRNCVITFAENLLYWLTGYAGMWGMKWIIATVFTDKNIIKDAVLMVLYRMSSTSAESGENITISLGEVIRRNFGVYAHVPYIAVILIILLHVVYGLVKKRYAVNRNSLIFYGMIILMPFGWFVAVKNHSYIHYWMTYRNVALSLFALLCFGVDCYCYRRELICRQTRIEE